MGIYKVGEVTALDLLFNNHDRVPCLKSWDRMQLRGNPNNLMASPSDLEGAGCELRLIDLAIRPLVGDDQRLEYCDEVQALLHDLMEATPGALDGFSCSHTCDLSDCVGHTEALQQSGAGGIRKLLSYQQEHNVMEIIPAVFQMAEHF